MPVYVALKFYHIVSYRFADTLTVFHSPGNIFLLTEKLIFLVSGGRPNDANIDIMRAIVNGNKKVSFKAVISVFVINRKFSPSFSP